MLLFLGQYLLNPGIQNCTAVNKKVLRSFMGECRRALAILDAGQGVNEVIWRTQAAAEERNREKKERARKNSRKDALPTTQPREMQTSQTFTSRPPPSPAPGAAPIPSTTPPQPVRQPGASGSNKRRKSRAKKSQMPAASNIPPIPGSPPAAST